MLSKILSTLRANIFVVQWKAPMFDMSGFTKLHCVDTGTKRNFEIVFLICPTKMQIVV